jgi:hypothetical protein
MTTGMPIFHSKGGLSRKQYTVYSEVCFKQIEALKSESIINEPKVKYEGVKLSERLQRRLGVLS